TCALPIFFFRAGTLPFPPGVEADDHPPVGRAVIVEDDDASHRPLPVSGKDARDRKFRHDFHVNALKEPAVKPPVVIARRQEVSFDGAPHPPAQADGDLVFAPRLDELRHVEGERHVGDRKSTRLNSSHVKNSYAVLCLKKKKACWSLLYTCGCRAGLCTTRPWRSDYCGEGVVSRIRRADARAAAGAVHGAGAEPVVDVE